MATELQKKLAREIVNNATKKKPKNKIELLVSTGYTETTAKSEPHRIMNSKGVQKELELLGFTEDKAMKVLSQIMNTPVVNEMITPDNQIRAAQEVFKVMGSYAPEKKQIITADLTSLLQDIENDEKKPTE